MAKVTVHVRPQEDDATHVCTMTPVAQALRVAVGLPRATMQTATRFDAMAQPSRLWARGPKLTIKCDAPPEVTRWLKAWDATGEGEPFDFEVETTPTAPLNMGYMANWLFPGWQMPGQNPVSAHVDAR